MFNKDRQAQPVSGPGMMMASALKLMGLEPGVVEAISHGLLTDLKMVVAQQAELLARQEYFMRQAGIWGSYTLERAGNVGTVNDHRDNAGHDAGSGPAAG